MFTGVLCLNGEPAPGLGVDTRQLLAALCPDHQPDLSGTLCEGPLLLVQARMCVSVSELERWRGRALPHRCPRTGRVVAFWGRLDAHDQLTNALGLPADAEPTDDELLLAAFDRWGPACAERLHGDFAAAVVDPATRRTWLVRDRLGVKPLYWRANAETVAIATSAAALVRPGPVTEAVDRAWIARELTGTGHAEGATPWPDVHRVPPGHWVELDGVQPNLRRYHHWRDDPPWATERDPVWVQRYRETLEEALRCRMRGTELIAAESSGGIDSSTVLAYLAAFLGDRRDRLFAVGFATAALEGEYIAEASLHSQVTRTCLLGRSGSVGLAPADSLARGLAAVGFPVEGTASGFGPLYAECRLHGIRTLFSGFGGDESVTNNGALLRRELRDRRAYRALYAHMRGRPAARAARFARAVALGRRWGAGHPRLAAAMAARWPHQLVRSELVGDLGLHAIDVRHGEFDAPYRRINAFVLENRMGSSISRRLEACTLIAQSYGLEYRWPLLDARLVQQWLSTPSIEKASREHARLLHRRATDGVVAPKVGWKPTKDMGSVPGGAPAGDRAQLLAEAHAERERLHPILGEVIDRRRLDAQIAAAQTGALDRDEAMAFQFRRNVSGLRWMNQWLAPA